MVMSPRLQKWLLVLSDFVAQIVAFLLGAWALTIHGSYSSIETLQGWWQSTGEIHSLVQFAFVILVLVRLYAKGFYTRRAPFWDELRGLLSTLLYLAILNGLAVLIAKWPFSRVLWLVSWTGSAFLLPMFRAFTRRMLTRFGRWRRPSVVIGSGETALAASRALRGEPQLGYDVIQFLGLESFSPGDWPASIPRRTVGKDSLRAELERLQDLHPHLHILLALEPNESANATELLEGLSLKFENLFLVPPLVGLPLFGMEVQHFFSQEVLLLQSKNNLGFRPQYLLKRVFDLFAASILLVLLSPLLLFIALKIRRSGTTALFAHRRYGYKGKQFPCYKFRSMRPDAEKVLQELLASNPVARKEWQEKTKLTNDPRVTPFGNFLRKTSLDELPQLINVIKGDMSLVGPRPIVEHELEKYGHRLDFYLNVRPGITGLWQVSGRSDTDYANRIRLDTWYVKNWSMWYDIAILFKTIHVVTSKKGAY